MIEHKPKDMKSLRSWIRARGYILVRSGVHEVYRNETGHQISVPNHSAGNVGLIKKICLAVERGYNRVPGQEEDHVPQTESPRYLNEKHAQGFSNKISLPAPVASPVSETPEVLNAGRDVGADRVHAKGSDQVPVHSKGSNEMKLLQDSDFDAVKKMKDAGGSYIEIAAQLTRAGYTNKHGGPLNAATVSQFMVAHGYCIMPKGITRDRKSNKAEKETLPQPAPKVSLLHEIQELMTSNLADSLKEKFIVQLVKERHP